MAASGTITAMRDTHRSMVVTILGVTQGSTSQVFQSFGYPIGSFVIEGTLDTSTPPTGIVLQGSNDGGTTWATASTITVGALPISGSLIGNNNEVFQLYQFNVTGGDSGTSLNIYIFLSATFG